MSSSCVERMMDTVSRLLVVVGGYLQHAVQVLEEMRWFTTGPIAQFLRRDSQFFPWFLGIFVLGGIIVYFLSSKRDGNISVTGALKFVFPAQIYRHPSSRMDLWGYLINFSLFMPAFAALTAMIVTGDSLFDRFVHTYGGPVHVLIPGASVVAIQFIAFWVLEDFLYYLKSNKLYRHHPE